VVCVSQAQAMAYCKWLETKFNQELAQSDKNNNFKCLVSLPSNVQWEGMFYNTYQVGEKDASNVLFILLNTILRTSKPFKLNYGNDITKEGIYLNYLSSDGAMFPARFNM